MRIFPLALRGGAAAALALVITLGCDTPTDPPPDPAEFQLLPCPTTETQTAQALIGPLGGLLSLGGTTVAIPAGALSSLTLITLTIPASPFMEIDVRANNLTSFLFNEPIAIRIDYSRCTAPGLEDAELSVWKIDPQTKRLLEFRGGEDDKATRTIIFTTPGLSNYAIAI